MSLLCHVFFVFVFVFFLFVVFIFLVFFVFVFFLVVLQWSVLRVRSRSLCFVPTKWLLYLPGPGPGVCGAGKGGALGSLAGHFPSLTAQVFLALPGRVLLGLLGFAGPSQSFSLAGLGGAAAAIFQPLQLNPTAAAPTAEQRHRRQRGRPVPAPGIKEPRRAEKAQPETAAQLLWLPWTGGPGAQRATRAVPPAGWNSSGEAPLPSVGKALPSRTPSQEGEFIQPLPHSPGIRGLCSCLCVGQGREFCWN